jgi:hypothetical protein
MELPHQRESVRKPFTGLIILRMMFLIGSGLGRERQQYNFQKEPALVLRLGCSRVVYRSAIRVSGVPAFNRNQNGDQILLGEASQNNLKASPSPKRIKI